jgi:hypothetical protein
MPIAADTVQISTSAARFCGSAGAQDVAVRRAAIETINRGYDRFIVLGAQASNDVRVIGQTPIVANTYGSANVIGTGGVYNASGQSTAVYSGGQPIVAGHYAQGITIKMFKEGDPGSNDGVSARDTLGPDWPKLIQQSATTVC